MPSLLQVRLDTLQDQLDVVGDLLGAHVHGPDGSVEGLPVFRPDGHRLAEAVDHRGRICSGGDGLRHLSAGTENGTEPLTDDGHERRLGDEVVGAVRDLLSLFLVICDRSEFLGGDHDVGHVFGFQGKFATTNHADLHCLPASAREDDILGDTVLGDGQIDIFEIDGQLNRLSKIALLRTLECLLHSHYGWFFCQYNSSS